MVWSHLFPIPLSPILLLILTTATADESVYYHTLRISVDGELQLTACVFEKLRVSPSEECVAWCFGIGIEITLWSLTRVFFHIDEYPPDANQRFYIPSAVITFPNFHVSMQFGIQSSASDSSLFSGFQERIPVRAYTEVLLVPLTTTDFSMPYNVITVTCTVFALYFGSLLNVLRRRAGEGERLLQSKDKKLSPFTQLISKLSAKLRGRPIASSQSPTSSSPSFINRKLVLKVVLVQGLQSLAWQFLF